MSLRATLAGASLGVIAGAVAAELARPRRIMAHGVRREGGKYVFSVVAPPSGKVEIVFASPYPRNQTASSFDYI